jgi:uncharacterized protein (DUF433 family)
MKNRHYDRLAIDLAFGIKHMDTTIDDILDAYPHITYERILTFIEFAARHFFEAQRR